MHQLWETYHPRKFRDNCHCGYEELKPLLTKAHEENGDDADRLELGVTASGLARQHTCWGEYHLVATNVPSCERKACGKTEILLQILPRQCKNDLATVFLSDVSISAYKVVRQVLCFRRTGFSHNL